MDKIYIEGLEVQSLIGVYDWERDATQRLLVDIVLFSDLQKPAYSDDVEDTLNYAEVAEAITQVAKQSEFALIEALGQAMITQIFTQFPVQKITLKLSKTDILADAQNVAVEFTRERKDT